MAPAEVPVMMAKGLDLRSGSRARRISARCGPVFDAKALAKIERGHERDRRACAAALRYGARGLNLLGGADPAQSALLADDC